MGATRPRASSLLDALPGPLRPGLTVADRLQRAGWETYLVGGVVRDLLLGRTPADLDIATAAPPGTVRALFAHTVPVGAEFGVTAVIADGRPYQVATFRREGPYLDGRRPSFVERGDLATDAARRDFTINALYLDPRTGTVRDLVGGQADLAARVVRAVGDPAERFREDRLRMLRAVRLATELGFTLDAGTRGAIEAAAPLVASVSAERVRDELLRLLAAPQRAAGARLLAETGLLGVVLPELAEPGAGDRLAVTLACLEALRRPEATLALAAMLHTLDFARVEAVCRRLRVPSAQRRAVVALIAGLPAVPVLSRKRPSEVRALLRHAGAAALLELSRAAAVARGEGTRAARRAAVVVASVPANGLAALLSGRDLRALGLAPGPQYRAILDAVGQARARGEIASPAEARAWVRARLRAGGHAVTVERSRRSARSGGPGG
ncbi:MAG: CCA tRNA nucleotidyltransferase [Armatimonadota bacterium]|nr:CCA tRNA nucleotidyltransferase [Armatimonadota bacterium]